MATLAKLFVELGLIDKGFDAGLDKAEKKASRFGGAFKKAFLGIAVGAGVAGVATGGALLKIGSDFDSMSDTIRIGTGATGDALKALEGDALAVFKSIPTSMDLAGTAIADLNTRTGQTGVALQDLARAELELARITGGDLDSQIANTTRLFGDWGIAAEDQVGTLDKLFRASQATGITVDDLSAKMVQFGAPLRQMGFDFDTTAALLGKFEKEGVNTELVMGSLRIALGKMAKEGIKDPREGFRLLVDEIKNAGSAGEATAKAIELFGARAGPDMAAAIREGRFEIGELFDLVASGDETILGAAAATNDWRENLQILTNRIQVMLLPVANKVFGLLNQGAAAAIRGQEAFDSLRKNGVDPISAAFMAFRQVITKGDNANGLSRFSEKVEKLTKQLVALAPVIWKYAIRTFQTLLRVVGFLMDHLDTIAPIVAGLVASFLLFEKVIKPIMAARQAVIALRIAVLALNPWLLVLTAAVTLFAVAWAKNWFGIREKTAKVMGFLVRNFLRFMAIVRGGKGLGKALEGLPKPLQKLGIAVRRIIVLFDDLFHGRWDELRRDWDRLGQTIGNLFKSIGLERFGQEFKRFFSDIGDLITHAVDLVDDVVHGRWSEVWTDLGRIAVDLFHLFIGRFRLALALFRDLWDLIPWTDIGNALLAGLTTAVQFMLDTGIPWLLEKGGELVTAIWDGMRGFWGDTVRPWLHERIEAIQNAIGEAAGALVSKGADLISGLLSGARSFWRDKLKPWLSGVPGSIRDVFTGSSNDIYNAVFNAFWNVGRAIPSGIWSGVVSLWDWLKGQLEGFWNSIPDFARKALQAMSPSRVFAGIGNDAIAGFVLAVNDQAKSAQQAIGAAITPGTPSLTARAITPNAALGTTGHAAAGSQRSFTLNFHEGAIKSDDPEGVAREIMKRIRYMEAGAA